MVTCGECSFPIAVDAWNLPDGARCPGCRQLVRAMVFPAMERGRSGATPEALTDATEASCFFHPESRALIPCEECGRFLCALCDIELDGRHICPSCFRSGVSSKKLETIETHRVMRDSIALATATLPALLFWPVIFGAPTALYMVIRYWRSPSSIVPRTKIRFILAAIFALVEMVGIGWMLWTILRLPALSVSQ